MTYFAVPFVDSSDSGCSLACVGNTKKARSCFLRRDEKKKTPGEKMKSSGAKAFTVFDDSGANFKIASSCSRITHFEGSCHMRGTCAEYRAEPSRKRHFSNFAARALSFPLYCADRHVSASCTSTVRQIESQDCTTSAREEVIHCGASKLLANAVLQLMPCC